MVKRIGRVGRYVVFQNAAGVNIDGNRRRVAERYFVVEQQPGAVFDAYVGTDTGRTDRIL